MKELGLTETSVLKLIEKVLQEDLTFGSGRIIGSMCTEPTKLARLLYSKYLEKNLGDPGLFPGTAKLENESIAMIGSLLNYANAAGCVVSGGTEANTMAMWSARKAAKAERPEAIVPSTAHNSFDKAADLLGVKLVRIPVDQNCEVNVSKVESAITSNTIMMAGIAGTTDLGTIDPIAQLSEIAENNAIHLHVDASFGGFVIPFLRELGYSVGDFDFKVPGVSSISIDPHKMGMTPVPAGVIMFRDEEMLERINIKANYLAGGESAKGTLLGTRPGVAAISFWAMMNLLGREGYRKIVARCMSNTWLLYDEVERMENIKPVQEPKINILGIKPLHETSYQLSVRLRKQGWALSAFPHHLRACIMPHIKKKHVLQFSEELATVSKTEKQVVSGPKVKASLDVQNLTG